MEQPRIVKIYHKLINSFIYFWYKDPIVITAWVNVRYGRVKPHNWGDDINVFLIEQMTGKRVVIKDQSIYHNRCYKGPVYSCIGSIIGLYNVPNTIIWGSGIISETKAVRTMPTQILSVRGEKTREQLKKIGIECPQKYGDPALLISKYYQARPLKKRYRLGIIPHYVDFKNPHIAYFLAAHKEDVLLIDIANYNKWTDIPDQIASCDCIISSSLHGLIVADSYSIPNIWVSFSDLLTGGDFKFIDYFSSVKRVETKVNISSQQDIEDLYMNLRANNNATIDFEAIKSSAPFKLKKFVFE